MHNVDIRLLQAICTMRVIALAKSQEFFRISLNFREILRFYTLDLLPKVQAIIDSPTRLQNDEA